MALPVNYGFPSTDSWSTNFTITQGSATLAANNWAPLGAAESSGYWASDSFTTDHYSQILYVNGGASAGTPGCTVRHGGSAGTTSFYLFTGSGSGSGAAGKLYKLTGGTTYSLLQTTGNVTNGDTIKLTVVGTTLETFIAGVSQGTVTDSSLSTGAPGIYGFSTVCRLDDFTADNIGSVVGQPTMTRTGAIPFVRLGGHSAGRGW